jgi:signal transduction histidine kinase
MSQIPVWKTELNLMASERHLTAAWVAVLLNPFWAINDYLIMPGNWKSFLVIRLLISATTLICILSRKKLNIGHKTLVFIPFLGISLQNAYMSSVMDIATLQVHTFAYTAIFIGAGMLLIWPAIYSLTVVSCTLLINIMLCNQLSPLNTKEILMNGGLLTFTVSILTVVLTDDRYRSLKKQMIAKLDLAHSHQKISDQRNTIQIKADELHKVNNKLNRFAYIISHDLKAPLRGVKHLAEWIRVDAADTISPETAEHLKMLQKQVMKMEHMINGVLEYSKATELTARKLPVDLNEILQDLIEDMHIRDHVKINIKGNLPIIYGNSISMKQVFQNLLSNAIKHNDKPLPEIEIGFREESGSFEMYIKDNGPGIPKESQHRIFDLFQTLRPGQAETSGVGLSIVKRIIEEAGGTIWIESDNGAGTTFFFTFLKVPIEQNLHGKELNS